MLPAPKGGSRWDTLLDGEPREAGFNAARPEGRESDVELLAGRVHTAGLQCCPPRRAGVGSFRVAAARRLVCCFNAARPEGRESVASFAPISPLRPSPLQCCPPRRAGVGVLRFDHLREASLASMLPAPKGGSRNGTVGSPSSQNVCFNAARPEGRESVGRPQSRSSKTSRLQCCPPRRAGVGRRSLCGARRWGGFNAARPEGRESARSPVYRRICSRASMLPAPKGGSRGRDRG